MLFDLLMHCDPLREDVQKGAVGFGINLEMRDFSQNKKKNLDLVICTPGGERAGRRKALDLVALSRKYKIQLTDSEVTTLNQLPSFNEVPIGNVLIALEAKAAMTAHQRACPRLFDELNSSHNIVHGHSATAIAAGLAMVNIAERFVSPDLNRFDLSKHSVEVSSHTQPRDARLVIETVRGLPRRADTTSSGFDALGVVVIDCKNDGSVVSSVQTTPAPQQGDVLHYEDSVRRVCHLYRSRFPLM